ncbi:MAG: peptidylprolyl isomerase [Rhodoferax sp.]|nr:peptidylprolyl isomerase [Rhodoferax sp.]
MTHRLLTLTLAAVAMLAALTAQAQGLQLSASQRLSVLPNQLRQADFIVAVVNSEPITNNEVRFELRRVVQQLAQQQRPQPEINLLARQVLERLINDRAQLQFARETGIRIDDTAVDQAEENIARQNQINVTELRKRLSDEGGDLTLFRNQLRDQLTLNRLREREVEARARVTELDIDRYLLEQQQNTNPESHEINLSQILLALPDAATPEQISEVQAKAQRALERARAGEDFAALVRELSQATGTSVDGHIGLRPADRYPPLFFEATQNLNVGDVSALVRSGAGFHILKVIEKKKTGLPATTMQQSKARHILLRVNEQLSESQALAKLGEFKKRLDAGQADFAQLARDNSQDGSAANGGDLGWANQGMYVPEFEEVMNQLKPGQLSEPFVSRFGVHLVQLTERRTAQLTLREQRDAVRAMLRDKKLDEVYLNWTQEVRGRAYVELRDAPL